MPESDQWNGDEELPQKSHKEDASTRSVLDAAKGFAKKDESEEDSKKK